MDLRRLEYFIAVAEAGGVTKASSRLMVSQSVLSRTIHEFEVELGHRLFHRTGRGMKVTEYGRQLLPSALRVTEEAARFRAEATALTGRLSGTVSIGLPGSVAQSLGAPLLSAVRKRYPGVFIRFVETLSSGVEELLGNRRIEIGLFHGKKGNPTRGEVELASASLYLIAPKGDRLTSKGQVKLAQAAQCPLVLPSRPNAVRMMFEEACALSGLVPYIQCEIDSLLALSEIVAAHEGYTVSVHDAVARDIASGRLQAALITDPPLLRRLILSTGTKHSLTTATRAIANLIVELAAARVKRKEWQPP